MGHLLRIYSPDQLPKILGIFAKLHFQWAGVEWILETELTAREIIEDAMKDTKANIKPVIASELIVVDLEHLYEFASGDRDHAERFLQLFVEQAKTDLSNMIKAERDEIWRDGAHSLKSGASGIGAWQVVDAAENAQRQMFPVTAEQRQTHIDILTRRLADVTKFIRDHQNQD